MDFKTRAYLTLTKKSGGILGAEMYVGGLDAFSAVVEDPSYYVANSDHENWEVCANDIGHFIPQGTPSIEYGPGGSNIHKKTVAVINAVRSTKYVGVDVNETSIEQALSVIASLKNDIEGSGINKNFWEEDFPIADAPSLAMIAGCSIQNLETSIMKSPPSKELARVLKLFGERTNGGWLLISADALTQEQPPESYLQAYRGEAHSTFNLGVLHRIKKQFAPDLDPEGFVYRAEFHKPSGAILHMAYATKSQSISFCGEAIQISRKDAFHLQNSFRFTEEFFTECVEAAGLEKLKVWRHPKTSMRLYLLKDISMKPSISVNYSNLEPVRKLVESDKSYVIQGRGTQVGAADVDSLEPSALQA